LTYFFKIYINEEHAKDIKWFDEEWYSVYITKTIPDMSKRIKIRIEPVEDPEMEEIFGEKELWLKVPRLELFSMPSSKYFLTILASPNAIQMSKNLDPERAWPPREELDNRYYGNLDNDFGTDLLTGRIFGVTVSDVSAYVARDVFFENMPKNRKALFANSGIVERPKEVLEEKFQEWWSTDLNNQFDELSTCFGFEECDLKREDIEKYYNKYYLLMYDDHGIWYGIDPAYSSTIEKLQSPTSLVSACMTCDFDTADEKNTLFCANNIRQGALVYMGADSVNGGFLMFPILINNLFLEKKSIGEAFRDAKNRKYYNDLFYLIIGDPTFIPRWW